MSSTTIADLRPKQTWHYNVVCIDLDGTILEERSGDDDFGKPLPGAKEAIDKFRALGLKVIVHTARPDSPKHVDELYNYLLSCGITVDGINENLHNTWDSRKPVADIYIDNRAIRFNNDWEASYKEAMYHMFHDPEEGPS